MDLLNNKNRHTWRFLLFNFNAVSGCSFFAPCGERSEAVGPLVSASNSPRDAEKWHPPLCHLTKYFIKPAFFLSRYLYKEIEKRKTGYIYAE